LRLSTWNAERSKKDVFPRRAAADRRRFKVSFRVKRCNQPPRSSQSRPHLHVHSCHRCRRLHRLARRAGLAGEGRTVLGIDNFSDYYDPVLKFARLKPLREDEGFTFLEADIADREAMLALAGQHPASTASSTWPPSPACAIRWSIPYSTCRPTSWGIW
jgi:hypothetical protein